MRRLEHRLHLGGGVGEDLGVGVRRRAGGIARMTEQVGGAPQQAEPGPFHVLLDGRGDGVEIGAALREAMPLGGDVAVVEREERHAQRGEELERGLDLGARGVHRVHPLREPGAVESADAEDVGSRPVEGVPEADGDPEMVFHARAENEPIGLVDPVGQWLGRVEAHEGDPLRDVGEEASHADPPQSKGRIPP